MDIREKITEIEHEIHTEENTIANAKANISALKKKLKTLNNLAGKIDEIMNA